MLLRNVISLYFKNYSSIIFRHYSCSFHGWFFFVAALTVTGVVMIGFTGYHVYQILTNQTTNERYKKYYLKKAKKEVCSNIYHRGILNNLFEEFCPQAYIDKALKISSNVNTRNGENNVRRKVSGVSEKNGVTKRKR